MAVQLYLSAPALAATFRTPLSAHRAAAAAALPLPRCYKCNRLGHYAHQGCPYMTWDQYGSFRYKFKKDGEIVERRSKGTQCTPDELLPGYGSDEGGASTDEGGGETKGSEIRRPSLPRGARGAPRGGRGAPRPRGGPRGGPKLRKAKPRHKVKKLTAKQREAEEKMARMLAEAKESEADAAQIKAWENEVKVDVPTRVCGRTGMRIRIDQWDSHLSSLSAEITPYMFLGGERNAHNHKELTYRTRVGFVLNAAWEVPNFFRDQLEYLHLPFQDFADQAGAMALALNRTLVFIDRARAHGSNVLVHCVAGISRSSTIVMHYLIRREGWTLKRAYEHVLNLRPIIRPNAGFFKELQRIDIEVHGKESMSFEEYMALEDGRTKIAAF